MNRRTLFKILAKSGISFVLIPFLGCGTEESTAEPTTNNNTSNNNTSNDDTSNNDTSNDDTSNNDTSNNDTSNNDTSNDDTSNDDTSNDDTSNDDTSNDDTSNDDTTGTTCVVADATGVANSHSHQITIPQADLENPPVGGAQYSCSGSHAHIVTLSQADLTELATNCTLSTQNSSGHPHSWIIDIN